MAALAPVAWATQGNDEPPSLRLGAGKVGNQLWEVSLSRTGGREGQGPKGRLRPCLETAFVNPQKGSPALASVFTLCVASPILRANSQPLIFDRAESTPRRAVEAKMTVVAIALAPGVSRVELTNFDGTARTLPVRRLSRGQARRLRLARVGYVLFEVPGPYCVDRIVGYGADGGELYDSGRPERCPPQEFPDRGRQLS